MNISINTENCDINNHFLVSEIADSQISIQVEMEKIASVQSKKHVRDKITELIQNELNKFNWLITGHVLIDFTWYLNAVEKQETDKIGDIDNITKPIIDSLIGSKGILIDDSQIAGLYSTWLSRNELISDNILKIDLRFNNDDTLSKNNLRFIQYDGAICVPINIDLDCIKSLFIAKFIIHAKTKTRKVARRIRKLGDNADRSLLCSSHDFHRTRISNFDSRNILSLKELNNMCLLKGLSYFKLIKKYRDFRK